MYITVRARGLFIIRRYIRGRQQWAQFKNAHLLLHGMPTMTLFRPMPHREERAFLFTSVYEEDRKHTRAIVEAHLKEVNKIEEPWDACFVYIYEKP